MDYNLLRLKLINFRYMKKSIEEKLLSWAKSNNWSGSHPLDIERFQDFIIESFLSNEEINSDDFSRALESIMKEQDVLKDYYFKYKDGFDLLKRYNCR